MVGRLARYLRFVGCDTAYARGMTDDAILRQAEAEGRVLVTRDRALARRSRHAVLLTSPYLPDQWRAVRAAYPSLPGAIAFDRCALCNGALDPYRPGPEEVRPEGVPWDRVARGLALYRCRECAHLYWDGSHTEGVRRRISEWNGEVG